MSGAFWLLLHLAGDAALFWAAGRSAWVALFWARSKRHDAVMARIARLEIELGFGLDWAADWFDKQPMRGRNKQYDHIAQLHCYGAVARSPRDRRDPSVLRVGTDTREGCWVGVLQMRPVWRHSQGDRGRMSEVVFNGEPPKSVAKGYGPTHDLRTAIDARPGEWGQIEVGKSAGNAANYLRKRGYEAVSRGLMVYARKPVQP